MDKLKYIIRESINNKMCELVHKRLDNFYYYDSWGKYPVFTTQKDVNEDGLEYSYPKIFMVVTKKYYLSLINDMSKKIYNDLGFNSEDTYKCIRNYVDNKITKDYKVSFSGEDKIIDLDDEENGDEE